MPRATQQRDSSTSGLVTLPLARPKLPGAHGLYPCRLPAESLLPLTSSRNQEPELVFGAGRSCRLQSGQENPLRGGGIWAKSCGMRGSQSCEGRKRVNWVEPPAEAGAWRWDRGWCIFQGRVRRAGWLQGLRGRGRVSDAPAKSGA